MTFLHDPKLIQLTKAFETEGFAIRVVGGAVRDLYQGKTPKDVDLCTDATPDEMLVIAEKHKMNVVPTGLQHGTLTFVIQGEPFEVTTLRIDTETDGRHAVVEFTRSFEQDAARRDLTFNAMSMDMAGNIYDYFGGREDLDNKQVVFVGNMVERVREDFLRVLRYFRFRSKITYEALDRATSNWFAQDEVIHGLDKISGERIWAELKKILQQEYAKETLQQMTRTGSLYCILPPGKERDSSSPVAARETNEIMRRLAILNEELPEGAKQEFREAFAMLAMVNLVEIEYVPLMVERLKMSAYERKMAEYLARTQWVKDLRFDQSIASAKCWVMDQVARGVNPNWAMAIYMTHFLIDTSDLVDQLAGMLDSDGEIVMPHYMVPFTITGKDLIARGVKPGKTMGSMINFARALWYDSGCREPTEVLLDKMLENFDNVGDVVALNILVSDHYDDVFTHENMGESFVERAKELHRTALKMMNEDTSFNHIEVRYDANSALMAVFLFKDNATAVYHKLKHEFLATGTM